MTAQFHIFLFIIALRNVVANESSELTSTTLRSLLPIPDEWDRTILLSDFSKSSRNLNEDFQQVGEPVWISTFSYEGAGCTGPLVNATGIAVGRCVPVYSSQRMHGRYVALQSYIISASAQSCATGAVIKTLYSSSTDCTGPSTTAAVLSTCTPYFDPTTKITTYLQSGICSSNFPVATHMLPFDMISIHFPYL